MATTPVTTPAAKKPHKDFPLFPAPNGQWAKKVKGHRYYFGSIKADPKGVAALVDWLARKDSILAGLDKVRAKSASEGMTLEQLAQRYLQVRHDDLIAGSLSDESFKDYSRELPLFVNLLGPAGLVAALKPEHFAAYRSHLEKRLAVHAVARTIRYIKAMFSYGAGMGWFPLPAFGVGFKPPSTDPDTLAAARVRKGEDADEARVFTRKEIRKLLKRAQPNFQAMILLALNTGMGPSDLGRLKWRNINMESGRLSMRRGKNGIRREAYLWKETRRALKRVAGLKRTAAAFAKDGSEALVFLTRKGHAYVRRDRITDKAGAVTGVNITNAISGTFTRLAVACGIKGMTFYDLRHTFRTTADNSPDANAVRRMMGRKLPGSDHRYVHGKFELPRLKAVAMIVRERVRGGKRKAPTVPALVAGELRLVS